MPLENVLGEYLRLLGLYLLCICGETRSRYTKIQPLTLTTNGRGWRLTPIILFSIIKALGLFICPFLISGFRLTSPGSLAGAPTDDNTPCHNHYPRVPSNRHLH